MSFDNIHYGSYGDEKVTSSSKLGGLPLSMGMMLPDGRFFRQAREGGTALVAGYLYAGVNAIADTSLQKAAVVATAVVGATTLTLTNGATTAITKDQYAEGYIVTASSTGTGIGYTYKIKANNSTATSSTCTITLYETDPILVAIAGGTTTVGIAENEFNLTVLNPTGTANFGIMAGVACASAAASSYYWAQRRGMAAVFTAGTVLVRGDAVLASTAVAGAVEAQLVSGTAELASSKTLTNIVGYARNSALTAGFATVYLTIE